MPKRSTLDAIKGIYTLIALGDALGLPLEILGAEPRDTWLENLEEFHGVKHGGCIVVSDDTELLLLASQAVISACGFNPQVFADYLVKYACTRNPVRNYDADIAEVIELARRGVEIRHAGRIANYGRGVLGKAVMLTAVPIAIFYSKRESVELMAVAQAALLGANPLAMEAARLYAVALHDIIVGRATPHNLLELLSKETVMDVYRSRIDVVKEALENNLTPKQVAETVGNSSRAVDVLMAALLSFVKAEGEPLKTIAYALSVGGDADSIAALAGGLAGAYYGFSEIPATILKLLKQIEMYDQILSMAETLYTVREKCLSSLG